MVKESVLTLMIIVLLVIPATISIQLTIVTHVTNYSKTMEQENALSSSSFVPSDTRIMDKMSVFYKANHVQIDIQVMELEIIVTIVVQDTEIMVKEYVYYLLIHVLLDTRKMELKNVLICVQTVRRVSRTMAMDYV